MTPDMIFERYEDIRGRLPQIDTGAETCGGDLQTAQNLGDIADQFDVYMFDAFGVLNVGEDPIQGAPERFASLKALGKKLFILTNSASYQKFDLIKKFQRLGYDVAENEIISSREILISHLEKNNLFLNTNIKNLGIISVCDLSDFPDEIKAAKSDNHSFEISTPSSDKFWEADAYIFLSSQDWSEDFQSTLLSNLKKNPKPIYVGNPDLVAPREGYFSQEPGYFAHEILDKTDCSIEFFGKPYNNTFNYAISRVLAMNPSQPLQRILMLGDTLHTDILGGKTSGIKTALVTDYGAFAGRDIQPYVSKSGIRPDFVIPTI